MRIYANFLFITSLTKEFMQMNCDYIDKMNFLYTFKLQI